MESIYSSFQDLNIPALFIIGLTLFAIGFWFGNQKKKRFLRKIHEMEKEIMDLNSELLYNDHPGSSMAKANPR
jgi:hypothetical protein